VTIKIIQILHHSPSWVSANLDDDIFDGWHVRTAKALQNLHIKNCQIECWLPEKSKHKEWQQEKNGITYRLFPSFPITYGREISRSLINALKQEKNNPILIHMHGVFNYTTYLISSLFHQIPVIVQHHGDCPPLNLLQRRNIYYSILPFLEVEHFFICKNALRNVDNFFCLTKTLQKSLEYLEIKNKSVIQGMGVDFNQFTPGDKLEARQKLNLPANAKILLYIGKLDRYKGSDKVINVYRKIKEKYNAVLLVIGASSTDTFYNEAVKTGTVIFPRQPHDALQNYYRAADIFILPGSDQFNLWGGIGISTIEALACNVPVITGTLHHFPGDHRKLGFDAFNDKEIINGIDYIFSNPNQFVSCRTTAEKYYNWTYIANNTFNTYQRLFNKYHGVSLDKEHGN
jgi:glycosyltransferase involved in cell wall biosynthesis